MALGSVHSGDWRDCVRTERDAAPHEGEVVKYLLGGFVLWLSIKGRFGNYAALATGKQ